MIEVQRETDLVVDLCLVMFVCVVVLGRVCEVERREMRTSSRALGGR